MADETKKRAADDEAPVRAGVGSLEEVSAPKKKRPTELCMLCGEDSTKIFNASLGARVLLCLVLKYIPRCLNQSLRHCDACRNNMRSARSNKIKVMPTGVEGSSQEEVISACESLVLRSPELLQTGHVLLPLQEVGVSIRKRFRVLRDAFSERGPGALDDQLLLLNRDDRSWSWEISPGATGAEVSIASRSGDSITAGLYIILGVGANGKVRVRSVLDTAGKGILVEPSRLQLRHVEARAIAVAEDRPALQATLASEKRKATEKTTQLEVRLTEASTAAAAATAATTSDQGRTHKELNAQMKEISKLKAQLSISKDQNIVAYQKGGADYNNSKKRLEEENGVLGKRIVELEGANRKLNGTIKSLTVAVAKKTADASAALEKAAVEEARAATMYRAAQEDVLEMQTKMKEFDALRMKHRRLELKVALVTGESAPGHGRSTRQAESEGKAASESSRQSEVEVLLERAKSSIEIRTLEDGNEDVISCFEQLEGAAPTPLPPELKMVHQQAGLIALRSILNILHESLGGPKVVAVVARLFPLSFYRVAGESVSREVQNAVPAKAGQKWLQWWVRNVTGGSKIFFSSLLSTDRMVAGTASFARTSTISSRALLLHSVIAYTHNPKDTFLLQQDVARLLGSGAAGVATLRGVLNDLGVSISDEKFRLDAPLRKAQSSRIFKGLVHTWTVELDRFLRCHIDNWDKGPIHCLCFGFTLLDKAPDFQLARKRIYEIEVSDLVYETPAESEASLRQLQSRVSRAVDASADEEATAAVIALATSERALDGVIAARAEEKASRRSGRRQGDKRAEDETRSVSALSAFTAASGGVGYEQYGDFSMVAGEVLDLLQEIPDRGLAVVGKPGGGGAGYVPLSHLCGLGETSRAKVSAKLHSPYAEVNKRERQSRRSLLDPELLTFDSSGTPAAPSRSGPWSSSLAEENSEDSDAAVHRAVDNFFELNSDLPRPKWPESTVFFKLLPGLASNRGDAAAAVATATAEVEAAADGKKPIASVSSDGQEFSEEHKYRDFLRKEFQEDIDRMSRELDLQDLDEARRDELEEAKRAAEKMRDAVSDMTMHELGQLHTLMTLMRALWKKNDAAAFEGLVDRIGLGHLMEHLRECRAGFLGTNVELLGFIVQAWLIEMCLVKTGEEAAAGTSREEGVLAYIERVAKFSTVVRVFHRVFCTEPSVVLDMTYSCGMRGADAMTLLVSSQKRALSLCTTGSCPNYTKNLLWSMRQLFDCKPAIRNILTQNPNTVVREVFGEGGEKSCYAPDRFLESHHIKPSKNVMPYNVTEATVYAHGDQLNVMTATQSSLEENLGRSRGRGEREHRASFKDPQQVVIIIRATIRKFILPSIQADLKRLNEADADDDGDGVGDMEDDERGDCTSDAAATSAPSPLSRIPTRAEEVVTKKTKTKTRNLDYENADKLGQLRAEVAAKCLLRKEIGGREVSPNNIPNFRSVSFFVKPKGEALKMVQSQRARALSMVTLLSRNSSAAATLNYPSCLAKLVRGEVVMNSGNKALIRVALRVSFNTLSPIKGASFWVRGSDGTLLRGDAKETASSVKLNHLLIDGPAAMKRLPHKRPTDKTGADVTLEIVKSKLGRQKGYRKVTWVEDLGDEHTKLPQERKRNLEKEERGGVAVGSPLPSWSLDADVSSLPKCIVETIYGDRDGGRREWQDTLGKLVTTTKPQLRSQLNAALAGAGDVSFCGVGSNEDERKRTLTLRSGETSQQRQAAEVTGSSSQREDTNLFHEAVPTLLNGKHALIEAADTDLLLIGTLGIDKLQQEEESRQQSGARGLAAVEATPPLGLLFVNTTEQKIDSFTEEFMCCNQVADSINTNPSLSSAAASIPRSERVRSVVALFILLGGDTTSYLYLPYGKALTTYLTYAEYVKSLVRNPTDEEKEEGWTAVLDEEAVKRLFMVLYACRNPTAISGWTSTILSAQIEELRKLSYMDMQKRVANVVFPLTMRFMPSWSLTQQHMFRSQHRLHTWANAGMSSPPDVPRVGFTFLLTRKRTAEEGGMDDACDDERRLEAPTEATVAALCSSGYEVSVVPNIGPENTTLAELFGNEMPMDVLLRASKARAPRALEKAKELKVRLAPLLAAARTKMGAVPQIKLTAPQSRAVVVAFKVHGGISPRDLSTVRNKMKGAVNASKEFNELVVSQDGKAFPWKEMGAPDVIPGLTVIDDEDEGDGDGDGDSDGDEDFGGAEVADDEAEDQALGDILGSAVAAVGHEAEELVEEIDDAPGMEEVDMVVEKCIRSRRNPKPVTVFDL